ncbi:MAG: hypothetical protein RIR00_56 [Pseudomonadota bacterium]|jgi:hypothetical protein
MSNPSRLVNDLTYLPAILGRMGLSIAEAQDELNAGYVSAVTQIVKSLADVCQKADNETIDKLDADASKAEQEANTAATEKKKELEKKASDAKAAVEAAKNGRLLPSEVINLLVQTAPPRYQFSETTFDFSADLTESLKAGVSGGGKLGIGAVAVNAELSVGYGYDYRAAARITCKLHALPVGANMVEALIKRVGEIDQQKLTNLPDATEARKELISLQTKLADALGAVAK